MAPRALLLLLGNSWIFKFSFFIQNIVMWAPWISHFQSTGLHWIFLRAQPCQYLNSKLTCSILKTNWLKKNCRVSFAKLMHNCSKLFFSKSFKKRKKNWMLKVIQVKLTNPWQIIKMRNLWKVCNILEKSSWNFSLRGNMIKNKNTAYNQRFTKSEWRHSQ